MKKPHCASAIGREAALLSPVLPQIMCWKSQLDGAQHPTNSYLVETVQGRVLIDPAADFPEQPVSEILITHVQEEHIAGAARFPEAQLYVAAGDEYLCAGRAAYEQRITVWENPWDWETRGNFSGHIAGARNERPAPTALALAGVLREGEDVAGMRVLATPGHGKNALTFLWESADRIFAFCGDLICGDGRLWNWFDAEWDYGPQTGQKTLLESARRLLREAPDVLLPSHGEPIFEAQAALQKLIERLERILHVEPDCPSPLNFAEKDGPTAGWREISPHLFQWKEGNCALLLSQEGTALFVDDGLCNWLPLIERKELHNQIVAEIKTALQISRIEAVVVTHFHGDHVENIPHLCEQENSEIVTLDTVAEVLETPQHFNLAAAWWWYDTGQDRLRVTRKLVSGEIFRWREYELEIFHLAGQTFYHCGIAAVVDGAKTIFVGDGIYGWKPACEPVICYNDNEPAKRGWVYSLERLIEREPELLICGHGSAIRGPMPLLQEKRARWEERLRQFDAINARENRDLFFTPLLRESSRDEMLENGR
jgi:glyoxylase-like metal-dependent hydrolase (beta-lactamase superfamily II)